MIFIPDLFTPYMEGREKGIDRNWNDLRMYNDVQKGQLTNLFNFATLSPRINYQFEKTDQLANTNMLNQNAYLFDLYKRYYDMMNAGYQAQANAGLQNPWPDLMGANFGPLGQPQNAQVAQNTPGQQQTPPPLPQPQNPAPPPTSAATPSTQQQQTPDVSWVPPYDPLDPDNPLYNGG